MNYSDSIEKNKILSQDPGDGAITEAEEIISVIMSGGREEVMMPDLTGMMREEAEKLITGQNLVLAEDGIQTTYSDVVQKGRVISQSIDAEERIAVETEISLTVSLGSLSEETALLDVPDLTGLTKEGALKKLEKLKKDSGFTYSIGEVKNKFSNHVAKGKIIRQTPEAGTQVRTNEPVSLVISKGPEMVQVPELVYISGKEARKKLEKAGLAAEVSSAYSDQVSAGLVISQDVESGTKMAKGSRVTITISLGKEPVRQGTETGGSGNAGGSGGSGTGGSGGSNAGGSGSAGGTGGSGGNAGGGNDSGDDGKSYMPVGGSFVVE